MYDMYDVYDCVDCTRRPPARSLFFVIHNAPRAASDSSRAASAAAEAGRRAGGSCSRAPAPPSCASPSAPRVIAHVRVNVNVSTRHTRADPLQEFNRNCVHILSILSAGPRAHCLRPLRLLCKPVHAAHMPTQRKGLNRNHVHTVGPKTMPLSCQES